MLDEVDPQFWIIEEVGVQEPAESVDCMITCPCCISSTDLNLGTVDEEGDW